MVNGAGEILAAGGSLPYGADMVNTMDDLQIV